MAKLFNIKFGRRKPQPAPAGADVTLPYFVSFTRPEMPRVVENERYDWVQFGDDNMYPDKLIEYLNTSSLHNAIVESKSKMVAGKGIAVTGADDDPRTLLLLREFMEDPNKNREGVHDETMNDVLGKCAMDYEIFGAFALEATWSLDRTRVASIKHVEVQRVRIGRDGKSYYYSEDWSKVRNNPPSRIPAFDPACEEYSQMVYVRNARPGIRHYGAPAYLPALSWISIDGMMSDFHSANIANGFNPSIAIRFYERPASPEEQREIVRQVQSQYKGVANAGKAMIFFSDGKERATDVVPIPTTNLDKQFLAVGETVVQQILSAHRVTSPMLLGIPTSGKLGYSNELNAAYRIFDATVITPSQQMMEKTFTQLLRFWGVRGASVRIDKLNPNE